MMMVALVIIKMIIIFVVIIIIRYQSHALIMRILSRLVVETFVLVARRLQA